MTPGKQAASLGKHYLDEMLIWNYNQSGSQYIKRGVKEARVHIKVNQADPWIQLGGASVNKQY